MRTLTAMSQCLLVCGTLSACEKADSVPHDRDSSAAASPAQAPMETSLRAASPNGSLTGDTLVLIGVGKLSLQAVLASNPPCNVRSIPALQRFMFQSDSMYRGVSIERPGCRDPRMASSDTAEWVSRYEVHGDTLMLFDGRFTHAWPTYRPPSVMMQPLDR